MATPARGDAHRTTPLGGLKLAPVESEPSLREQVGSWLRNALFTGELEPGAKFTVPALAAQFGVSATPVREAVLDLVQQDLVVAVPSRGFEVVDPGPEVIAQTIEIRRLLEVPVTCSIGETVTPDQIAHLRDAAEAITGHAQSGNLQGFVEADYEFHRHLTGLCGNAMLTDLIEDLRSRTRIHTVQYVARIGLLGPSAQQHHELLGAMEKRDLPEVARITEAHMDFALAYAREA